MILPSGGYVRALDLGSADLKPVFNLAAKDSPSEYRQPIELFTVIKTCYWKPHFERLGVPYSDGFVGNLQARFRTELVEAWSGADGAYLPASVVRICNLRWEDIWLFEPPRNLHNGDMLYGWIAVRGREGAET